MSEPPSSRERLFAIRDATFADAAETMRRKNADYATAADPIANFRAAATVAKTTPELYLCGRMAEKLVRLSNILAAGEAQAEDGVAAECRDLVNFPVLILFAQEAGAVRPASRRRSARTSSAPAPDGP